MSKNPEIRFKNDVNDWEEKELKDVILYNEKSKFPASHASDYGRYRFYKSDNGEDVTFSDDYIVDGKNIIINDGGQFNAKFSIGKVAYSDHCISFHTNENTEEEFVYQNITKNNDKIDKEGFTGGALKNIDREYFNNFKISIPDNVQQKEISSLLSSFDKKIELEEETVAHLQSVKASMLQKMFPRDGQKVPEIRFSGFTDDWEQRKLSNVAEIIGGGTPSTNISEYWDGDINWYAPAEIGDQIYADESERKITKLGLEKSSARMLPAGRTVLFTSRAGIGKTAILRSPACTNQGFQSIVLNDDTNPYFVYSMTDMIKEKAERVASGSTFAEISGKMLGNLDFMFPSKPEQDKIGAYFESIDNLITLHQRKCEKLKDIKEALLNKLLV